ncbi:OST3_/ OST6 family [Hexamita inflata]|uniref:Transporter family protein n=1 Tax=Hexamita inflata TaxID=28002 RepID=A0AA86QVQ3_9EUKA|nr:OST3 / OST6 family [Hexamita inflata]CAI9966916.1 OST3 / OST6 family [Hexamita inflata]
MVKLQKILDQADKYQAKGLRMVENIYKKMKPMYMLFALFALHWFSTSGSVFNMINNAQPYGIDRNDKGAEVIKLLAEGTHNQYSTEGFLAGVITCAASAFFILALRAIHMNNQGLFKILGYGAAGMGCVLTIHIMYKIKG